MPGPTPLPLTQGQQLFIQSVCGGGGEGGRLALCPSWSAKCRVQLREVDEGGAPSTAWRGPGCCWEGARGMAENNWPGQEGRGKSRWLGGGAEHTQRRKEPPSPCSGGPGLHPQAAGASLQPCSVPPPTTTLQRNHAHQPPLTSWLLRLSPEAPPDRVFACKLSGGSRALEQEQRAPSLPWNGSSGYPKQTGASSEGGGSGGWALWARLGFQSTPFSAHALPPCPWRTRGTPCPPPSAP